MRIYLLLFFLFGIISNSNSQSTDFDVQAKGVWFDSNHLESASFEWNAHWIWLADKVQSDVMLARRTFNLDKQPDFAQLRITASSQYELWVNGTYICRGPARSAPHHQSFDILDVIDLLNDGDNTIAVRVHNQDGKYSYHFDGRAGLLVQLDLTIGDNRSSIFSDDKWKVVADPSWNDEAQIISRFQLVVNDKVDLGLKIRDWNSSTFDDDEWDWATPLMRDVGWPSPQKNASPQALTPPWTSLVPRDVPYLIEKEESVSSLIEARRIGSLPIELSQKVDPEIEKSFTNFLNGKSPLVIPASDSLNRWLLLFDFGKVINGNAQLEIQGKAGTEIDILAAPFIVNNQFSHQVVFSEFKDQIILSGQKDIWEATYFKPTRYLGIVLPGGKHGLNIHHIGIRHNSYPFELQGSMSSADAPWIEQYMEATVKTIEACTTDGYTDNYRERRQYAQTGYYAALGNYWTFGDHALQRRYLVQVAQEQETNGIMPAYAPLAKDDYMIIMDSNCLYIRSLRNYLLYSGDTTTLIQLIPAAKKLMSLLHSYTNEQGLIYNPPYPYWLDHALNDRRGANANLNGHYLGAIEDFAEVLEWLDDDNTIYVQRANLLRRSFSNLLWDDNKQLFADAWIDGKRSVQFSEHANGMALAMNLASKEQSDLIAQQILRDDGHDFVKRKNGMTVVTPAMSYFLHKGLCAYGYIDESLNMFRERFDKMLDPKGNGTLYEEWWLDGTGRSGSLKPTSRSDAQTESAFPPALFAEFLLGVTPVSPGWKQVQITNVESEITRINGVVPTPLGLLSINWDKETDNKLLTLDIPKDMTAILDLNTEKPEIQLNGESLKMPRDIQLATGKYVIKF